MLPELMEIEKLLREINAVYERSFYDLKVPQEAQEAYHTAVRSIADVRKQFASKLSEIYITTAGNPYLSDDPKDVIAHLQWHRGWIVFLKMMKGSIDTLLYEDAPNSSSIYAAGRLLNQIDPDREGLDSMEPREREEDVETAPLSAELDKGDVLYMPPLAER
jgi:hypothetical protein